MNDLPAHWIKLAPSSASTDFGQNPYGWIIYAALGVLAMLSLFLIPRLLRRPRKPCKWHRTPAQDSGALACYTCQTCGVEAYSSRRAAPLDCKRDLHETSL